MGRDMEIERTFRRMHPRLWRGLLAYCGDREVASDAEAEAFAQAIARGSAIRELESWIWTASFRIASGMLQKRSLVVEESSVAGSSEYEQPLVELIELLGELSEQQRQVAILRYVGNYKPSEIAQLLNTSPGTVRVQLHRAHESLRDVIGSAYG